MCVCECVCVYLCIVYYLYLTIIMAATQQMVRMNEIGRRDRISLRKVMKQNGIKEPILI